ncbi:MAG: hypothetical protein JXX14_07000, partial [Deltaproteobacteria bacterium]|nr:hypothetical protein [Deltaproteobacteria bacterium]
AGDATIIFDSQEDFIEINTQQTLRFGDRNIFELTDGTDPTQVQFYSNTYDQIKIGTDTTFTGVITAPYGQIYAFSRTHITGNLLARSVWVDTDSTVSPIQNCTEFNTEFDDTAQWEMSDALRFEDDSWYLTENSGSAEISLSDMYHSDGDASLSVTLNGATDASIVTDTPIDALFTENATDVSIKIDVISNAVPYTSCQGQIGVYLKSEDESVYTLAGTMQYDPHNEFSEQMETFSMNLPSQLSQMVIDEDINILLKLSAAPECNAVFWIDQLEFCDNNGGCNIQLPSILPDGYTAPTETPRTFDMDWAGNGSEIMENVPGLSGVIHPLVDVPTPCTVILKFDAALGQREDYTIGSYTCGPGVEIPFNIDASNIPFSNSGIVASATVVIIASHQMPDGSLRSVTEPVESRYYHHNTNGTITHFTGDVFFSTYDGYWFKSDPSIGNTLPLISTTNETIGEVEESKTGFDTNGPPDVDTDTDDGTDTDTIVDTSTLIVVE